jgi:formate hydrogenlyase subunit 6/NADH:ubiquinone oxidoreductase subunit I
LSMDKNIPQVNVHLCISCFCCQEICPEKAITLR